MQKKTSDFCFTIDTISQDICSGWYIRHDNKENVIIISYDDHKFELYPDIKREDVVAAGFTTLLCGFNIEFSPPLKNKDNLVFRDIDGNILYSEEIKLKNYIPDNTNNKIINIVEPFVEFNIKKVQESLMLNSIFKQYKKLFSESLSFKLVNGSNEDLITILAEMKTTLHLLSAAYLDYTRYKDPDFLRSIPEYPYQPKDQLMIDMRGDITGDNWYAPEEDGRWAGPLKRSSLLFPNLAIGEYEIGFEITGEIIPDATESFSIRINDIPIELKRDIKHIPCKLTGTFFITDEDSPFIALEFIFSEETREPETKSNLPDKDTRKLSIKIKYIYLKRKVVK